MANNQEEANREALNGLNESDRKETEEILSEIDADAGKEGAEPDAAKVEEDRRAALSDEERAAEDAAKAPGEGKPEDKKPDEAKPEGRRNSPKLMPAYVHKVAEKTWEKEKGELLSKIEELSKAPSNAGDDEAAKAAREAKIKTLAEKYGHDEAFIREILDVATENSGKLPEQVQEGLKKAHMLTTERELETEEANYSADFDRVVVPLIKAEYGADAPDSLISDIKEDLKVLAYSEEYGKVPYAVIFKGQDQFRGLIPDKKKGAEGGRGGTEASVTATEKPDLTQPLSDEVVKTLSDSEFDEYSKNMESKERNRK
jgi:hypothetical protein